jgi:KDO2-lipid IV(A) lauroyltransferase
VGVSHETRYRLEAAAARLVASVVRRLPRRVALAAGRAVGRLWGALDSRHRSIAVDNLRLSFPERDPAQLQAIARGVYAHFGAVMLDLLWMEGRASAQLVALVEFEGVENLRAARERGRGILYCTAHLGNWEIHAIAQAVSHEPLCVVARPLDNPALDARLVAFRQKSGNAVLYKKNVLGTALRLLRDGKAVAFLVDQNVQADEGIFVDFFGRPAASTTAAAALAVRVECPIVHGWTELRPDGRYLMRYGVMRPHPGEERTAEVERLTRAMAQVIEGYVRTAPEQWLWLHRRWKTRPPGERPSEGEAA